MNCYQLNVILNEIINAETESEIATAAEKIEEIPTEGMSDEMTLLLLHIKMIVSKYLFRVAENNYLNRYAGLMFNHISPEKDC